MGVRFRTDGYIATLLTWGRILIPEAVMTWKDKLEIGLKEDAPYRKDNLPPKEIDGPQLPTGPGRSPEIPLAREDGAQPRVTARRRSRR
jgi:hypothetical protein